MDKKEIASVLEEIGSILEIKGENPFKVRAYYNAARILNGLSGDLASLIEKNLLIEVKGIGEHLADHIAELYKTGKLKEYEKIRKSVPDGVLEMLAIPGIGPKKVKALWEKLDIKSIDRLERACLEGKIANLEGFGAPSQRKIFEGIQQIKKHSGQFLYSVALGAAEPILKKIEQHPKVKRASLAGSLRRCREVVKDIDLVVATHDSKKVMEAFLSFPEVAKILQQGETKSSVLLRSGIQSDLRCVSDSEFPYALHHFTGSKEHNVMMRGLAQSKGLKMNEYGVFKGKKNIPCKDEMAIFGQLGLAYIPPELREGMEEIEWAKQDRIPKLVELKDIHGVFHCHTTFSDGAASVEEMAMEAKRLGFQYFGIADHSSAAKYAGGLTLADIKRQFKEIDAVNKKLKGLHVFKGTEADILTDGTVDMGDKILSSFDYVVASVHSSFNMPKEEMTKRVIKAIKNKYVRILGHMTGRLLLSRESFQLDIQQVIDACADYNVAIEINANPMRLDIDWRNIPYAKEKGVLLIINPDAHSVEGISHYRYGVGIARKGGLSAKEIINTRDREEIIQWLQSKN